MTIEARGEQLQPETHPSLPRRAAIFVGEAVGTVQAAATVIKLAADYLFTPVSPLAASDKDKDKSKGQGGDDRDYIIAKRIAERGARGRWPSSDIARTIGEAQRTKDK